jgi:prophage tail gpP-like protein
MPNRKPETIRVESSAGVFDRFESVSITYDIDGQTEATFEVGDDTAWQALEAMVAPGQEFTIIVNDRIGMKGRAEVNESPGSTREGIGLQLTCRTKMADARYCSANPATRVEKTSLEDFVLAVYAPLGYSKADFIFAEAAARDLMTGKSVGGKPPVDLAAIQIEQAKVNPPETIAACVDRHLKRHHMMHWDGPDGRIVVGAPDDEQRPSYRAICKRPPNAQGNNLVSFRRSRDWGEVASDVTVYGQSAGKDVARIALKGTSVDLDLAAVYANTGHFLRPVVLPVEQVKEIAQAEAQAMRERSARARRKDAWEFTYDGWAYWDGSEAINFAPNTVVDVDVEAVGGGARGKYLCHRVELRASLREAPTAKLSCVAVGIWVI